VLRDEGLFDWAGACDKDVYQSLGALLPICAGAHTPSMGPAVEARFHNRHKLSEAASCLAI
jgi:hypothetical protein